MKPDIQRDLIPSIDALHLIGALNEMKDKLLNAAQQWVLLDETGNVPAAPSYSELLRHASNAQDLSRDVFLLAAEFAQGGHVTTHAGSTVLKHLATAATMSSHAIPYFTQTAEHALALARSTRPSYRRYLTNDMVQDHVTGRTYLRRTSGSLRDAAKELNDHLGFQRFLATLTRQEGPPAPPPPRPRGNHR